MNENDCAPLLVNDGLGLMDALNTNNNNNNNNNKNNTNNDKTKKKRIKRRIQKFHTLKALPSLIIQKKLITLRSTLLATSLCLILFVFWILDSLKDATFALLVDGDLSTHQPRAKMASVLGTLVIVVFMEIVSHERSKKNKLAQQQQQQQQNRQLWNNNMGQSHEERMRQEEEILSGGGTWTKMDTQISSSSNSSSFNFQSYSNYYSHDGMNRDNDFGVNTPMEDAQEAQQTQIPISVFQTVGIAYILIIGFISYLLRYHPEFQSTTANTTSNDTTTTDTSTSYTTADMSAKEKLLWQALGYIQYLTIESYGSITIATFWSFTNSTLTLRAAKTYYGFIIAMAQFGAISGATLVTFGTGIPNIFCLACVGIGVQMGVMVVYGWYFPYAMQVGDDQVLNENEVNDWEGEFEARVAKAKRLRLRRQQGGGATGGTSTSSTTGGAAKTATSPTPPTSTTTTTTTTKQDEDVTSTKVFMSGVYLILRHNYLLLILGVSCLYEISLTCLDYEMKLIGLDRFSSNEFLSEEETGLDGTAFANFMGRYGQLTNLLSFLLSYYAFPYWMEHYGLSYTLRIFPTLLCIVTLMTFIALPMNLPVLFLSMSLLKAMTYSINDPAKEILYMPTSNTIKFKAKFWIDVVGARIAKALGSGINTYAGTAERIVKIGSVPSVLTALVFTVFCYAIGVEFDSLLERGEIVGLEEEEEELQSNYIGGVSSYDDDEGEESSFISDSEVDESGWESNVSIEFDSPKKNQL